MLLASRVSKTWNPETRAAVYAVREVSLAVRAGEAIVITGPSGSGKTTLLSMLGGLLHPDAGSVRLAGVDLGHAPERQLDQIRLQRVGFVFQRGLLLPALTARQNVALPLRALGAVRRAALARADALLDQLDLGDRANLLPHALSAGECQRVALARALVNHPPVVLADEPTAHLDAATGAAVADELRRMAAVEGSALVVVTHDERLVSIGTRGLRLVDGRLLPDHDGG
jgi:putative ABC transport system ATP-binding protein